MDTKNSRKEDAGQDPYEDLYEKEHPVLSHPRMSREKRAAQFAPFAALTGYDALLEQTRRITTNRAELGEDKVAELNEKLCLMQELLKEGKSPCATLTIFVPDAQKEGGKYETKKGFVTKLLPQKRLLYFVPEETADEEDPIFFENLFAIEGDLFNKELDC